jgi:hypothetical protein
MNLGDPSQRKYSYSDFSLTHRTKNGLQREENLEQVISRILSSTACERKKR